MQKNTRKNTKKKIAPIVIAAITVLYLAALVTLVLIVCGVIVTEHSGLAVLPILLIYAGIGVAVLIGVLIAARQRLQEINGGEEEEAKKY